MTTFTGIVLVTGTNDYAFGGMVDLVMFDSGFDYVSQVPALTGTTYTYVSVYEANVVEGVPWAQSVVSFETSNQVYERTQTILGHFHDEVTVIDGGLDFTFAHRTATSGAITVLNFGFNTGFSFTVTPVINRRIFPTAVADATLFPGDVPRGEPLNP